MDASPKRTPKKKPCNACGEDIPEDARMCKTCKFPQVDVQTCVNCRKLIPRGAPYCNECKTYQSLRLFSVSATVVALVAAFIGVVSAVIPAISYFLERDSHTKFKVTSADKDHVVLKAWNTGRKPSTLIGYRLIFEGSPDKAITLDLAHDDKLEAKNIIAPGMPVKILLTRPPLTTIPYEMITKLRQKPLTSLSMTLEIDVEESSDSRDSYQRLLLIPCLLMWPGSWTILSPSESHTRSDSFQADRIREFIEHKL